MTFLIVPSISSVSKYPFLRKKDEASCESGRAGDEEG